MNNYYTESKIYTVSKLNKYIKNLFENDYNLQDIWILGEISNFKLHSSGHMYFVLKDKESQIRCVMFRGNNYSLRFAPGDGMKVKVRGDVSVYEKRGEYQLYVKEIVEAGKGELYLAFERLKLKLKEEGLFSEEIKKKLPLIPKNIAVITSPTGAAIRDIITISLRRFPNLSILVVPSLVQGVSAAQDIAKKIDFLNKHLKDLDFIIVGRGGGSLEELWAFNEEILARSIYNSKIPIVSAVGHETDFTISDFVADLRAPTPSAAAEMTIPDKNSLINNLTLLKSKIARAAKRNFELKTENINSLCRSLKYQGPENKINQYYQYIDEFSTRLNSRIKHQIELYEERVKKDVQRLNSLSPWAVIERGYSVCRKIPGKEIIKRLEQVEVGAKIEVIISDGRILSKVEKKEAVSN
ncbi:MAG TPA: exodeoxyribonuclease VII large subunit [Candidatus Atribacteria bacterium]|nr:exodeoxyribonuclease VII large subunit [Candidatus Atribacteria bacterium]